ncbi:MULTISPECIES: GerAB/ArcD/ProY family transporter [unclassified Bacillus (in: firmicutes)]|uniref:GerAB/ArcD/ProY family transporter n=1 Tax=unclassified Bacillus (in: firmicutes) TaxID=185979 RepID=UPI001BE85B2B|nr:MULTISPECIES: GerAB/ArcD/ProY family transporter [unclassified Bacillus (in: firmicutes)]MBT2725125.1 GerAB/ArcD/ProY family transporter [Bacillus sp. ISL-46]MBT2744408.1 GerAB/ArcD/ProY family transporter [Bacillus sp. ISL-77]
MEKARISGSQLFVLVTMFEMGSAILFGLGAGAKQDAWIAVLLGLIAGLLLFLVYHRLFMFYPDIPFTSYVQKITGNWIGRFIGFLYIVYFIYQASRILRDFGELLVTTIYTNTPLMVINCLMILTIIYATHKGFEVIARVGELFFGIIYFIAIIGVVLIVFSDIIHLGNLQPMLENGWKPVLNTVVIQTINFPFGEMVVFTMLLPYLNDQKKARRICLGGMILSGINIIITVVVNIAALGADFISRTPFPLLRTISKIQIADFIERLDALFMLYLVIGGFFKITLYFYAAVIGTADLFQFKSHQRLSFPIGLIVLFASVTVASNYSEHSIEGGKIIPWYLHFPLQFIIPVTLLCIAYLRNSRNTSK